MVDPSVHAKSVLAGKLTPDMLRRVIEHNLSKMNTDPALGTRLAQAIKQRGAANNTAAVTFQGLGRYGFIVRNDRVEYVPGPAIKAQIPVPTTIAWFSEKATRDLVSEMIVKKDERTQARLAGEVEDEVALRGITTPQQNAYKFRSPLPTDGTPETHVWVGPEGSGVAMFHLFNILQLFNDMIDVMDFSVMH